MDRRQFEQVVLDMVYRDGVERLTPASVAYKVGLSVKACEKQLDQLVTEGTLELDSDDDGNLFYFVPGVAAGGVFTGGPGTAPPRAERRDDGPDTRRAGNDRPLPGDGDPSRRSPHPNVPPTSSGSYYPHGPSPYHRPQAPQGAQGYGPMPPGYAQPQPGTNSAPPPGYGPGAPYPQSGRPPSPRPQGHYPPPNAGYGPPPQTAGQGYRPQQGYGPGQGYGPAQGQGYGPQQGYGSSYPPPQAGGQGYGYSGGQHAAGGYGSAHGSSAQAMHGGYSPQGAYAYGQNAMVPYGPPHNTLRSPTTACILSSFPGAGQLYNGQVGKALTFFLLTMFMYGLVFPLGLIPHIWSAVDAHNTAKKMNYYGLLPP